MSENAKWAARDLEMEDQNIRIIVNVINSKEVSSLLGSIETRRDTKAG